MDIKLWALATVLVVCVLVVLKALYHWCRMKRVRGTQTKNVSNLDGGDTEPLITKPLAMASNFNIPDSFPNDGNFVTAEMQSSTLLQNTLGFQQLESAQGSSNLQNSVYLKSPDRKENHARLKMASRVEKIKDSEDLGNFTDSKKRQKIRNTLYLWYPSVLRNRIKIKNSQSNYLDFKIPCVSRSQPVSRIQTRSKNQIYSKNQIGSRRKLLETRSLPVSRSQPDSGSQHILGSQHVLRNQSYLKSPPGPVSMPGSLSIPGTTRSFWIIRPRRLMRPHGSRSPLDFSNLNENPFSLSSPSAIRNSELSNSKQSRETAAMRKSLSIRQIRNPTKLGKPPIFYNKFGLKNGINNNNSIQNLDCQNNSIFNNSSLTSKSSYSQSASDSETVMPNSVCQSTSIDTTSLSSADDRNLYISGCQAEVLGVPRPCFKENEVSLNNENEIEHGNNVNPSHNKKINDNTRVAKVAYAEIDNSDYNGGAPSPGRRFSKIVYKGPDGQLVNEAVMDELKREDSSDGYKLQPVCFECKNRESNSSRVAFDYEASSISHK